MLFSYYFRIVWDPFCKNGLGKAQSSSRSQPTSTAKLGWIAIRDWTNGNCRIGFGLDFGLPSGKRLALWQNVRVLVSGALLVPIADNHAHLFFHTGHFQIAFF